MAYFAKLDDENTIIDVVSVNNEVLSNSEGVFEEQRGIDFLTDLLGHANWKQCSHDGSIRKNIAEIGQKYSEELDAFLPSPQAASWILDPVTVKWISPIPYPTDGRQYVWDEDNYTWKYPDIV
jgi:hypothetical protein